MHTFTYVYREPTRKIDSIKNIETAYENTIKNIYLDDTDKQL